MRGALRRSGTDEVDFGQRFEPIVGDPTDVLEVVPDTPPTQRWHCSPGPNPDGIGISPTRAMDGRAIELQETQIYPTQEQEQAVTVQQPMAPTGRREDGDCWLWAINDGVVAESEGAHSVKPMVLRTMLAGPSGSQ